MKANELRIGNLVYDTNHYGGGREIEIDSIHVTSETLSWWNDLCGIPLTKDWLIKFGFETDEYKQEFSLNTINLDCEYTDEGEWVVFLEGKNIKPTESKNEYHCHYYPKAEIKYVHQLQNLYFSLTWEELTIKKDESNT